MIVRESVPLRPQTPSARGHIGLDDPRDDIHEGRWVAKIKWIPAAVPPFARSV